MARTTRVEADQTARRILHTAIGHFRDYGYGNANLMAIAQAAGVTRGAVYHHYPNKQALFAAVVEHLHADVQGNIESAVADLTDPWDQLERGCEAFIDSAIDPAIQQILLVDAPAILGWQTWRSLDERTSFASLLDVLQQLEESGEIQRGSAAAAARLLSGAMNEAVLWIASEPDTETAKAPVKTTLRDMIRSIKR